MADLAASLSLHGGTSLTESLELSPSFATRFFESKPFSDWRRNKESEAKTQAAIVNRLNEVIRGLSGLSKVMSGR